MSRRKALRKTSLLALLEKVAWNKARQSEWPGTRPGRVQWPRPASGQWLGTGSSGQPVAWKKARQRPLA